jgi:hypothetical protein
MSRYSEVETHFMVMAKMIGAQPDANHFALVALDMVALDMVADTIKTLARKGHEPTSIDIHPHRGDMIWQMVYGVPDTKIGLGSNVYANSVCKVAATALAVVIICEKHPDRFGAISASFNALCVQRPELSTYFDEAQSASANLN